MNYLVERGVFVMGKIEHDDVYYFAVRIATAIADLKSSHVFFLMQKAFGEIDWKEAEEILESITTKCNCKNCKTVKRDVMTMFNKLKEVKGKTNRVKRAKKT